MNQNELLEQMLLLLEQNDIPVRRESVGGAGGGLCKMKSRHIFFLDKDAPVAESAVICAHAIHQTMDIDSIYIVPEVRDFLEKNTPDGI